MSLMRNRRIRCDWCGKLTSDRDGHYQRQSGRTGRIVQPEWERFPGGRTDVSNIASEHDICEECALGHCHACGSEAIVQVTPTRPGPTGWGGRCKTCGHQWALPSLPAEDGP